MRREDLPKCHYKIDLHKLLHFSKCVHIGTTGKCHKKLAKPADIKQKYFGKKNSSLDYLDSTNKSNLGMSKKLLLGFLLVDESILRFTDTHTHKKEQGRT